jgi:hypothetical protein
MPANIIVGPVAPENLQITINRGAESIDLSTVSSVSLEVIGKTTGDRQTWTTTIESKNADTITVKHIFQSGNLSKIGVYTVLAFLVVSTGVVRATCGVINVTGP